MKRLIISIITILALSFSLFTPARAADVEYMRDSNDNFGEMMDYEQSLVDSVNAKFPWKSVFKAVKWVLVKGSNALYYRSPTIIDEGGNWVASSSGSVSFGNGSDDIRRVRFTNKIDTKNNKLDLFAQAPPGHWLQKISIFVDDSSGDEVVGKIVTHNQHVYTSSNLPYGLLCPYW